MYRLLLHAKKKSNREQMLKLWTSRAHVPRKHYSINREKIESLLPFDIKSRSNAIKVTPIDRASRGQIGCNETTRLYGLRYVYVSFEHKVLGRFTQRRVLLHPCCCAQGVSIDLGQIQRRVSSVVLRPDTL